MIKKIISIDPGMTVTGWSYGIYQKQYGVLNVDQYGSFKPIAASKKEKEDIEKYGQRPISLRKVKEELIGLITKYKPDVFVSEDIFFNPLKPTAVLPLAMYIGVVELVCLELQIPLYKIPTRTVKMIVAGTGGADKLMVFEAIKANDQITFKENKKDLQLIEHISDAVAVEWAWCNLYGSL